MPISQQFDPQIDVDVSQRHREDINPTPNLPNLPSFEIPSFTPDTKPIQISGDRVSIPSRGSETGVSGYSTQSDMSFWNEQQRQAEIKAAQDTQRRRDNDRQRLVQRYADKQDRDTAGLASDMMPRSMGMVDRATDDGVVEQDLQPSIDVTLPTVDGVATADEVVEERERSRRAQAPFIQEFVQESVGQPAPVSQDEIEYLKATGERAKRIERGDASERARRLDDERTEAVDIDESKRPTLALNPNRNSAPDGKPRTFRTLAKDVIGSVTNGFRGLLSNRRSDTQKGRVSDTFVNDFKERMFGNGFYAQMTQSPNYDLRLHQVGIGWQEVVALIEQAPEVFENLLRESGCVFDTIVPELGEPVDVEKIRRIVNYADGGVWVTVSKSPEVDTPDIHRMQLIILDDQERGLAFHPIIAPLYNADFDGDQAFVYFDKSIADMANSTMDHIVSWEGRTNVNADWIPSISLADGTDVKKFIRENIFDEWNDGNYRIGGIVDAMSDILENEFADDDQKMSMWVRLFRMARDMAGDNDILMSRVIQAAYDFVREQAADTILQMSGTPISPDELPSPKTDADRLLFDVVEYLIEAKMPNNWQRFRSMFSSFPGNIEGKNPAFRFTGDIGRSYAIDDRIRAEIDKRLLTDDGDYEVVTDDDWKVFHHLVSKYVASQRMAIEKKKDERWQASRDAFRTRTIRRICKYMDPKMDLYAKDVDLSKGYPGKNGLTFEFIEAFVRAYNVEIDRANQASARFSDRYQHVEWGKQQHIELDNNGLPVDFASLAEPLLEVYPNINVRYMFRALEFRDSDLRWEGNPNHLRSGLHSYENESGSERIGKSFIHWLLARYENMSILEFSRNNRVIWNSRDTRKDIAKKYSEVRDSNDISDLQYRVMLAIADKKTSAASTFNNALTGQYDARTRQLHHYDATRQKNRHAGAELDGYTKTAMEKLADALCELVYLDDSKIEDRSVEIERIVFIVTELFPDMAHYFDIDTVEGLSESGYGRILMDHARNAMRSSTFKDKYELIDNIASTWMSMVFDYEMSTVYEKSSILDSANIDGTAIEVAESTNALQFAWNKLASKSEVWHGIVKEIQSGGEGWEALHEIALENKARKGESGFHPKSLLYAEYWESHESGSIVDVIQDTNLAYGQKVDIITDIVRWQENDPWLNGFETPFQMRIGTDQLYSLNSANRQSALGDITNFSNAYSSYAKTSRYNMHSQVKAARDAYDNDQNRGRLLRTIRNLNSMPWLVRKLSDDHYASVFVSILDKTTHQLEKGSQAAEPNFAYQAMTTRHTDGAYSDLYQTDGRVLGVMSTRNVSISDFLRIFSDQNESITVYNRRGAMSTVNASAILYGDPSRRMTDEEMEKALWQFLSDNPRVASMLRMHEMCSAPDGTAWVGVSKNGSIKATIDRIGDERGRSVIYKPVDHAKYLTELHPGFASILVLCDPIGNRTSREYPNSIKKTRNYLLYRMCEEARKVNSGGRDVNDAASEILEEFGVTNASMIEANRTNYSKAVEELGRIDESDRELEVEAESEATEIYGIALEYVARYINEISNEVDLSSLSIRGNEAPKDISDRRVNRESFSAFIDINQELGASKTARSTGVNGQTTFEHVEWVRFIDAQDRYVDLEWVMTCAETDIAYPLNFNGAMTSVVGNDGQFVPFEASIDENGEVVTNYDLLRELSGNSAEIVIDGNGAQLRDKSTRKDGRVMPAVFKQMTSKRSKGSEALNLKLKKYGLDALDSIIKMSSKLRTDIDYLQLTQAMNQIYEARGHDLMAVHLALAYELFDAASSIGYKDLSLSDFTCIASLMTIVGENGRVYVRSIEQLSNAIRYSVSRLDHKPTVNEMQEIVNRIVNDNSMSGGVGIMTFDAREAFDEWRPASLASSVLPDRHASSNETRNHDMLDSIEEEQWDPSKPEFTQSDANKLMNKILYEKREVKTATGSKAATGAKTTIATGSKTATGSGTKAKGKTITGVPHLKRVFDRCKSGMARNYIPIGGVGAKSVIKPTDGNEPYRTLPVNAIGPRYAYIVGDGKVSQKEFDRAAYACYRRGITMIVSNKHIDLISKCKSLGDPEHGGEVLGNRGLSPDALEASPDGDAIIPFFDMRLNGAEALPIDGNGAAFTVPTYDFYMTSYEAKFKALGDAVVKIFRHCANRIRLIDEGELSASGDSLFPNVFHNPDYRRYNKTIREATSKEIEDMIVNSGNFPSIDIGVSESNSKENRRHARSVAWAIQRYRDRWILLGGNVTDTVSTDLKPGDIVSWQVCEISNPETGDTRKVFAPVIPFPLYGSVGVPPRYSITSVTYDGSSRSGAGSEGGVISVAWKNETPVGGNTVKSIDPMSGASKGVGYVPTDEYSDPDDDKVVLETGTMVDFAMEEAATSSRKEGTDKRLKTLVTLMIELRKVGYNFGDVDGAFPGRPDIAERVSAGSYEKVVDNDGTERQVGRISKTEWRALLSDPTFRFSDDRKVDTFLRVESMKSIDAGRNPSDFMSNLLDDGDGIRNSGVMWEFETSLEPRLDYEDALLHFFHTVNPKFCPDGVYDMSEDHYFRMWRDGSGDATGYDQGQVQMKVPVKDSSGNWYLLWHNVYTGRGFFAKQTTMLGRPNVRTAKFNPSAAHAMSYTHYGLSFDESRESKMLDWALGGMRANWSQSGSVATDSSARSTTEDADAVDNIVEDSIRVPDVDADTVENVAQDDQAANAEADVPIVPFRDMTPRSGGRRSSILDEAYRRFENEQSPATASTRQQMVDQDVIDEARAAFVSNNDVITNEDIADYLSDPEATQAMLDYVAEHDLNPDVDEDADEIRRYIRREAVLKKYGNVTSTGNAGPSFDIDFDNYDFSGKPVVSPDAVAIINGEVSDEVRRAYIFEVERKMAEDGGYLDDFLAYFTNGTRSSEVQSIEEELLDGMSDEDRDLAEYLRQAGARATVEDVRKTEADAKIARRNIAKAKKRYVKGAKVKGLELPAYRYTIAYQRPLNTLSRIKDELDEAIKNVDTSLVNDEGQDVNIGYGMLLRLYEQCDLRVKLALEEVNVGGEQSAEMSALPKIRERVKKGTIPTTSEARSNLVDTVRQIEATVEDINDLMHRANKVLQRDFIDSATLAASQRLSERATEARLKAQQKTVDDLEGWRRIKSKADPTKAVLARIAEATAPRIERSQRMLHDFILGDGGTERENELARIGMRFIETIENPTKILTSNFHGESRTETRFRTEKGSKHKKAVQVTEARPSWGEENDVWLDRAQEYLGTGGGRLRVMKIAMCRMGLGIASDGTISHVSADNFEISDRQLREVIKDIIAYCERGMSPTDLSDSVRGDPRASRDDSGKFVVVGGTKRYPLFMPRSLWYEICSDPTSKFHVEGEDSTKVTNEHYLDGIKSWRQNVHNAIEREGDIEQLVSIDNLARAVLSMDGFDGSEAALPEIQTSLDIDALEADAVRSDDPDIYVPLEYMIQQMHESAERERRRQKHRVETDSRPKQIMRTINRQRRTSGSFRASILISSPFEEAENLVRANVANAMVGVAQYEGEALTGADSKALRDTQFDYNNDEYRNITNSPQFAENVQVANALQRIGGEDLLDFYIDEKDEAGRAVNTKFTKAELNSFLVRYGYIHGSGDTSQGGMRGAVENAKNVTRAAAAMAEKIMTDFALSEGIPVFATKEARTFAKVYMSDARTLYGDLARRNERGESGNYAYAVDVNDAVATAQSMGTGALVRKMLSTSTGREALATMGFFGAGRKNAISHAMERLMWKSGVTEMLIAMSICKYPVYGIGKSLDQIPLSGTVSYLATCGYSGIGDFLALAGESGRLGGTRFGSALTEVGNAMSRASNYQMGTRSASLTVDRRTGQVKQRRLSLAGFRKNLIYDMTMAGSTLGKVIITMQIIKRFGLTPPEDPDNRLLYEEWRIGGEDGIPFKLAWWLDDLTGISIPVAMGLLINEGGSWDFTDEDGNVVATFDGGEMAPSIIFNGIASMNDGTFVFEAIDLFTHWDEHWRNLLGLDDLDKIGNAGEGELAPNSVEEWAIITTRNALLDQFGQMVPAIVNEVVPTSKDWMFAGERDDTSPYLLWNTKGGKISLEEAQENGYVTGVDDWSELKLRQLTRNYWVLGKIMDIVNNPQTGYTWAEMPESERADKAAQAKWSQYSFDFSDIPSDDDPEGWLTMQGQAVYKHILENYDSADDAAMDGFYLSYDALANARSYCESMRNQLSIDKDNALASINGIGGSYNEIRAKIEAEVERQRGMIKKVNDILWDSNFPTSVPKYNQQTTSWGTRYVDSEGNPANIIDYWRGDATRERYAYGDYQNPFLPITRPRQSEKGWNDESIPWNFTGDEETDEAIARGMYRDLVENGLTYQHRDGTVEDLGRTYFGGISSPDGLMLSAEDIPTTGSRIDVPKRSSLPSFLRTKDDMEDYYKKATGIDFGSMSTAPSSEGSAGITAQGSNDIELPTMSGDGITGNSAIDAILDEYGVNEGDSYGGSNTYSGGNTYGGYRYRYGGGYSGSGSSSSYSSSYNPRIYSNPRSVYSGRASGMSTRAPYKASTTYLRPSFYTSGSRKSYLRMN